MPSPSQPETLTFPMLQIGAPESPGAYIHQSVPILEYLEDRFPEPDMRGATPELRAKGRDMLGVLDEATGWLGLYMHQSRQLFVPLEKQFAVVANVGLEKMHKQLDLLERYVGGDGKMRGGWLMGTERPMLVDCVLLSTVQFAKGVYDMDILEGHGGLRRYLNMWERRESWIVPEDETAPEEIRKLAYAISI